MSPSLGLLVSVRLRYSRGPDRSINKWAWGFLYFEITNAGDGHLRTASGIASPRVITASWSFLLVVDQAFLCFKIQCQATNPSALYSSLRPVHTNLGSFSHRFKASRISRSSIWR
jgi:hypothetical protein